MLTVDWPTAVHPLNVADAHDSKDRVERIEAGLQKPDEAWFWHDKAMRRIEALDDDAESFGLLPHEDAELDALRALIAGARPNG